ncbi:MAG: hypothetical protein QM786_00030 [Breznakibacter sp.]
MQCHYPIWLPVLFLVLEGCGNFNRPIDHSAAIITGKIVNHGTYPPITQITLTLPDYPGNEKKYVSEIDSNGKFRFEFQPLVTREVSLSEIGDIVVVAPGNNIHVEKDFEKNDRAIFSGDNASLNNHISSFRERYLGCYPYDVSQTLIEYKRSCDAEKARNIEKLNEFIRRKQPPEEFREWGEKQIEFDYCLALLNSPVAYTEEVWQNAERGRQEYFSCIESVHRHMDSHLIKTSYYPLSYWLNVYQIIRLLDENKEFPMQFEDSAPLVFNDFLEEGTFTFSRQFALRSYLEVLMNFQATSMVDGNLEMIKSAMHDPFLVDNFETRYQQYKNVNEAPFSIELN